MSIGYSARDILRWMYFGGCTVDRHSADGHSADGCSVDRGTGTGCTSIGCTAARGTAARFKVTSCDGLCTVHCNAI